MKTNEVTEWRWMLGLLLLFAAIYGLTSPGRIDIIDGQFRYEVAHSIYHHDSVDVRDIPLLPLALSGADGRWFAVYGITGSLSGVPLLWLADQWDDPKAELARFAFSMASPLFGAALVALLFFFLRALGTATRSALGWSLVLGLCSQCWPLAVSSFDQIQHAFWVLAATYGAYQAGRRASRGLAALGGLAAACLINHQISYALIIPALAVPALVASAEPSSWRERGLRYLLFGAVAAGGLGVAMLFNLERFGAVWNVGYDLLRDHRHPPFFGDPREGAAALLFSPGKSVFLFTPPLLLALLGWPALRRREPYLAWAILLASSVQFTLNASLSFYGSDWAWGPRYLVPLLPLWALAWPELQRWPRRLAVGLAAVGLMVQLLAISVDHQRFFFDKNLEPHFWYQNPTFYYRHAQLFERPGELWDVLRHGPPTEARFFVPAPDRSLTTYSPFGTTPAQSQGWMRNFQVFYFLRPWPVWMYRLAPGTRPFDPTMLMVALGLLGAAGGTLLWFGRPGRAGDA